MDSTPQSLPQASAGAALLAERRRQSLSLGDVSRQLKLAVRQVEALERDDYSGFRPVFVHGFIRNYAKLLGLEHEPLIRAADSMLNPALPVVEDQVAPERTPVIEEPQKKPVLLSTRSWTVLALVIFAGIVLAWSFGAKRSRDTAPGASAFTARDKAATDSKAGAKTATVKPAETKPAQPAAKPAQAASTEPVLPPIRSAEKPAAGDVGEFAPAPVESNQVLKPQSSPATDANAADDAGKVRVRMIFAKEAWVEIKDRTGATIFGQLNAAGTRRSVSGEPPLSAVVGNASGVQLFLGEKSIDLSPYTRSDIDLARLKLE
jgi:cytoskeleton protein RodZ